MAASIYTWRFLRDMTLLAAAAAVVLAAVAAAVLRDPAVVLGLSLGAGVDVATMLLLVRAAHRADAGGGAALEETRSLPGIVTARFGVKALVLVVAALMPRVFNVIATAVGILVVDTTILVAGSVTAVGEQYRFGKG